MILLLFFSTMISCFGQSVTQSNPLEYTAIGVGESRINEIIGKQNATLDTLNVLHGGMVVAETKMKKWEEKYNSYLKTTQGYSHQSWLYPLYARHADAYCLMGNQYSL